MTRRWPTSSTSRWLKSFENVALEGVVDKEVTKQVEVYKELVMDMVVEEVNRQGAAQGVQ